MAGKKTSKIFQRIGKKIMTDAAEELVQKRVLILREEEKQRFDEAEGDKKLHVLMRCVRERRSEVGEVLTDVFLKGHRNATGTPELSEIQATSTEPAESEDTLNLCPYEEYQKLCKERNGEVLYSARAIEKARRTVALIKRIPNKTMQGGDWNGDRVFDKEKIYPIKEKGERTRLALIICNIAFDHLSLRSGAENDVTEMKTLLESLDYTVEVEQQLTAKDMKSVLQAFAARPEHRSSDSTFLVLMSHGLLEGICGTAHSDEEPDMLPYDTIFQIFNNRNCSHLKDKPKVIIIQACRGVNLGEVKVSDSASAAWMDSSAQLLQNTQEDAVSRTHIEKDFIAFYSSTPHNVSWRHRETGSLFIVQLVRCFRRYSWRLHLEEVFRKVQRSFDDINIKIQMPTIERQSLTRYFYLFPGI